MLVTHIGDTLVTVIGNPSLDPHDDIPYHYTVHFRDIPTDVHHTISCTGEDEAYKLVAAWLVADDDNIGLLEPYRERLYKELESYKKFVP